MFIPVPILIAAAVAFLLMVILLTIVATARSLAGRADREISPGVPPASHRRIADRAVPAGRGAGARAACGGAQDRGDQACPHGHRPGPQGSQGSGRSDGIGGTLEKDIGSRGEVSFLGASHVSETETDGAAKIRGAGATARAASVPPSRLRASARTPYFFPALNSRNSNARANTASNISVVSRPVFWL